MVKEMQSVKEEVILKQKELQRESRLECPSLRLSVCDLSKKRIVEKKHNAAIISVGIRHGICQELSSCKSFWPQVKLSRIKAKN